MIKKYFSPFAKPIRVLKSNGLIHQLSDCISLFIWEFVLSQTYTQKRLRWKSETLKRKRTIN
jgi:hypothetical protein